jgi:sigma-B regulation protein RsbU (phosphoserine phosphatase)
MSGNSPWPNADTLNQCQEIESALMESEQRFRQMAEMTGEWLWEQDPDGYYIYSSAAVREILGYSPDDVLGKHYTRFLTAQNNADQAVNAALQKPFYGLVNDHRHKDGHLVYTESTGLPIFDADGKLLKWRGVDHDITAKKYFQDALIESERRTRLIIESSTNAIVIMDAYGIITDWNRQSEKIFGWLAEAAIGQPLAELIVPARFRAYFYQALKLFLHTGICPWLDTLVEQTAVRQDGSEFPVELSVAALKMGNTYSFSGFIHDITTRKAAEQQIRDAQIELAIAQSEIKIAQHIQTSLLPSLPIQAPAFTVAGLCLPADKIGGDYFDYFYHDEQCLDMVIADVSGHSIGPALFMVEARSVIRTQASRSGGAAAILGVLNHFLYEDLNKADYFITAFYAQYDLSQQRLAYANAGHSSPLLLRAGAAACEQLDADGMILGVRKSVVFEEKQIPLAAGDVLLLYTDGLTEADNPDGEFFGLERVSQIFLQQAGQAPQTIIEALLAGLKAFCQRESFNDDITLLVFQRH